MLSLFSVGLRCVSVLLGLEPKLMTYVILQGTQEGELCFPGCSFSLRHSPVLLAFFQQQLRLGAMLSLHNALVRDSS